jgi:hypothetical protein
VGRLDLNNNPLGVPLFFALYYQQIIGYNEFLEWPKKRRTPTGVNHFNFLNPQLRLSSLSLASLSSGLQRDGLRQEKTFSYFSESQKSETGVSHSKRFTESLMNMYKVDIVEKIERFS